MKYFAVRFFSFVSFAFCITNTFSQSLNNQENYKGWHLKDKSSDSFAGISLDKAYLFLKNKKSTPVIVGVVDSGIDTLHEDLKGVLWTNTKEIPGNGIDDDGNGYVDDIHGWNFLGGKDGTEIEKASSEKARVYHGFKNQFQNKNIDTNTLSKTDLYHYKIWLHAAKDIEPSAESATEARAMTGISKRLTICDTLIMQEANVKDYSEKELEKLEMKTEDGKRAKLTFINLMNALPYGNEAKKEFYNG